MSFSILGIIWPNSPPVTLIKLSGIALCVIYSFLKFRKDGFLVFALFLTLTADIILAINNVSIFGVGTFCLVQLVHTFRLSNYRPYIFIISILASIIIFIVSVFNHTNPLYVMVGFYGLGLLFNIYLSGKWFFFKRTPASRFAFIGFVLFLACDICVAVSFLSSTEVIPPFWQQIANYAAWFFYYPSQILISNSTTL